MKCAYIGCCEPATRALKVIVPDLTTDATSAEGFLGVELCVEHMAEAQASQFFDGNPAMAAAIRALAYEGTEPDLREAYLESVPVGCPEHLAFRAMLADYLRPNHHH